MSRPIRVHDLLTFDWEEDIPKKKWKSSTQSRGRSSFHDPDSEDEFDHPTIQEDKGKSKQASPAVAEAGKEAGQEVEEEVKVEAPIEAPSDEKPLVKKREKKTLYAKEARWKDIPDWGELDDCPLMELPGEVLDRCFGLRDDLAVSFFFLLDCSFHLIVLILIPIQEILLIC